MANQGVLFPLVRPTSRTYKPGKRPSTIFEAQNGATTLVEFGTQQVNAELKLVFRNISDENAGLIIDNYNSITQNNWVLFDGTSGLSGMAGTLQEKVEDGYKSLRWRYAEPPQVTSVFPGISTVSCSFVGYFYGA